jgi:DNA replication and repair protein RecF
MVVKSIVIENVRNHTFTKIEPSIGLNVFYGKNGAGKTSILEAISIGSITKSFVTPLDQNIVRVGENYYAIELIAISDNELPYYIKVYYQHKKKKEITDANNIPVSPKDIVGNVPTVVLTPHMRDIIFGSPNIRREFLDRIISQVSSKYLDDLLRLRRILKQRNKLLADIAQRLSSPNSLLDVWTDNFIAVASRIISMRQNFLNEFVPFFKDSFNLISGKKENTNIKYVPNGFENGLVPTDIEEISVILSSISDNVRKNEIERGLTLFGPQKDDFRILLNDNLARDIASQGQSKSLLIALKYAELQYFLRIKQAVPVVLFDDIFSELDIERIHYVLSLISEAKAQTFITITEPNFLEYIYPVYRQLKIFRVEQGKCFEESN